MRTLGKPKGAATRAALGGIAASLMIGLAACGNTVAGPGTAGPGAATPSSQAGAARATPRPSGSAVNPGGVMIPAHAAARVAVCREIPRLTRMTFMLIRPSNLHVREALPDGFTIRDPATVRQLATQLCALPRVPAGHLMCPRMTGASYRLFFFAGNGAFPRIAVGMSGCRVVTGLGAARSWSSSTALGQALPPHLDMHFPSPAY